MIDAEYITTVDSLFKWLAKLFLVRTMEVLSNFVTIREQGLSGMQPFWHVHNAQFSTLLKVILKVIIIHYA